MCVCVLLTYQHHRGAARGVWRQAGGYLRQEFTDVAFQGRPRHKELIKCDDANNIYVTEQDVRKIVSEITGVETIQDGIARIDEITTAMSKKIFGQREAILSLSESLTRCLAGLGLSSRPRGIFLFLGKSGVGKTALATSLAKELFDSEESIIRYDMSEYTDSSSVSKLIGSAPGYVGYNDRNSSLEKIRRHPYSIILLDEIDKAHPDIISYFLGAFDTGYLTDSSGRKISIQECYIIMTSNELIGSNGKISGIGFNNKCSYNIKHALESVFRKEFINRIDEIIVFNDLDYEALKQIAISTILEMCERAFLLSVDISIDPKIYDLLATEALNETNCNARTIKRLIVDKIETPLAKFIVGRADSSSQVIRVGVIEGTITVESAVLNHNV